MKRLTVFSRGEIETLIDEGQLIIIANNEVLKLDNWAAFHPGGLLPIYHMVGKDATDPLSVYHSLETLQRMRKFRIGVIDHPWIDLEPPISRADHETSSSESASTTDSDCSLEPKPILVKRVVSQESRESVDCKPLTSAEEKKLFLDARSAVSKNFRQDVADFAYSSALDHVNELEVNLNLSEYPSLDPQTQREISVSFQELHQTIRDKGLYTCKLSNYMKEISRYSALFLLFAFTFRSGWYFVSAIFLGLFWQQIMFSAHDAGHLSISHNFKIDTAIGIFIADFCCGLSMGWWKSSHNVHHLVPNHPEHDPDIQNVPLFSTSMNFCKSLRSTYYGSIFPWDAAADFLVRIQQYTYYPVMGVARFNLYALSWHYLLSDRAKNLPSATWTRPLEIFCMMCYWYMFGYRLVWLGIPTWTLRVIFVLTSHIATMPLHVQITLSHWGMSSADLGASESFAQKQLRTTMDVDCPAWLDFIHGGLQFQAVHHLFPRLPRHNLREAQGLVKQFCRKVGVKYTIFEFLDGNEVVIGRLAEISKQLEILEACRRDIAAHKV